MTPTEAYALRPGDTVRWTPNPWAQPIDGRVLDLLPEGAVIEWDDGHVAALTPDRLTFHTFAPGPKARPTDEESP